MGNRQSVVREAARFAEWVLREVGRELRVARLIAGMTQGQVAGVLGTSISHVSRIEHGLIKGVGLVALSRHAAVVGLKPWIKLYPVVGRPLDRAQLALFAKFRERIAVTWQVILEAPMPIPGDLRAADALLTIARCRCMIEIITRLADFQAQVRMAHRKQRDIGASRLILVVAGNDTNRRALRDAGVAARDAFPLDTKATLAALASGVDPGADGLVLL
jgi:transcriptional regulator with XRE-family HTH domain